MANIVTTITEAFTSWISGITGGISSAFESLMIDTNGLTALGTFFLTFFGIGVASGLVYLVLRIIRR